MKSDVNFLLGDAYTIELPDRVDPAPQLYSVLWYNGAGRYVAYQPFGVVPAPDDNPQLARHFSVRRGGRLVSIYRALDEPSTRVAYWTFPNGFLGTFFDDR